MIRPNVLVLFSLVIGPLGVAHTGSRPAPAKSSQQSVMAPTPGVDEHLFSGLRWRQVGPFRGGRALAGTGVPGDPSVFYFGAAAGGVWKSTDTGVSWLPLFDSQPIASIGSIAVSSSDHNIIYVGSGEACIRGNISYGDGVYKSMDAGKTWKNVGLTDTRHIGAVIVDPKNPNIVFVAALGHTYGQNEERGVFRTADGGASWQRVLYKDSKTGAIDVVFDPNNSNTLFASLWEVNRTPWSLSSGGPGSGLYKSADAGITWKPVEGHGLPSGIMGRIGVSVSGADSNRVYALIESKDGGGLYRSEDGGDNWIRMNEDGRLRQRAWYFTHIFADPKSADTVYVLNTGMFRSTDGGRTFNLLPAPHGDHHGLWIDPDHPERLINGNDGGATISIDGGKNWSTQYNQPTAQFYHVITDNRFPYYIYGAQQDNSTVAIKSYDDEGVIGRQDWFAVGGGESGYIAPYPPDPNITYAGAEGFTSRFDKRTEQLVDISVWPLDPSGRGAESLTHRFNWTSPLMLSPHDPNTLYTAGEAVFKTNSNGRNWTAISGDLTRNDKSKQKPSGGPITLDITSVEYYKTIFALAESPVKKDTLWAGTDDGLLHLTTNGGQTWTNVTPKDMSEGMISIVEASHHEAGTAYIAVDRHKFDDVRPYIYRTHDSGRTWTLVVRGIPEGAYARSVREDPVRKGLLFAGTETGVYVSLDEGDNWQPLKLNLPTVPVHDLTIHDTDLVAATHGRSFWVLDNITPLRQINATSTSAETLLYRPETALRLHYPDAIERRGPVGDVRPAGAIIDYYFKIAPKDEVTLEIVASTGRLVRALSSREKKEFEQPPEWPDQIREVTTIPTSAGMNRYTWNLRWESPVKIPGAFYVGTGPRGPLALPGKYTIKLTVDGHSQSQPLEIVNDPRMKSLAPADLQTQHDLLIQIHSANTELHRAVNQIRDLRSEFKMLQQRLGSAAKFKAVLERMAALDQKMTPIEEQLIQVNMKGSEANLAFPNMLNEAFDSFVSSVEAGDGAPTEQQYSIFKLLSGRLDEQLRAWKQILATDVPALNDLVRKSDVPVLRIP